GGGLGRGGRSNLASAFHTSPNPNPNPNPSPQGGGERTEFAASKEITMNRSLCAIGACVALALATFAGGAAAETKLRVGKAQAGQFAFVPVHVGVETGIFKKHGLDIEIANFGGDAKLLRALAADGIDIALGGGPTIAFVQKGTPMLGIAALADAPGTIMLVVLKDGPVKTEDDLKGRTVSVSTAGSLTYWLAKELSRQNGWGNDGIKIA